MDENQQANATAAKGKGQGEKESGGCLTVLFFAVHAYLATTLLAAPYYNWRFAKEHGFWEWVCFGEVVATTKAFGWPYDAFIKRSGPNPKDEFEKATKLYFEARNEMSKGGMFKSEDSINKITKLMDEVLVHARLVDIDEMNKRMKGLGTPFRDYFIRGVELQNEGLKKGDVKKQSDGNDLQMKWRDEFMAVMDKL